MERIQMDISITAIVPVYNVEKYLVQCLDSIIKQQILFDEVILINDGSTDQSLSICERYVKEYSYFKLINQKNAGLSAARNRGICAASCDYVMFLDSDDYLRLDTVKILKNQMQVFPYDAVYFDADIHYEDGCAQITSNRYDRSNTEVSDFRGTGWEYFAKCYPRNYVVSACMAAYKRKMITEVGVKFPEGLYFEDNYFSFMFLCQGENVKHISEKLYQRRYREHSIITGRYTERKFVDYIKVVLLIWDKICKNTYYKLEMYREILMALVCDHCTIILDNYQLCIDDGIVLEEEARGLLKYLIGKYFELLKKLQLDIESCDLAILARVMDNYHRIICWELDQRQIINSQIWQIAALQRELYLELLKKLPLNRENCKVGIYGMGKHTEGLLTIYENLIGKITCDMIFIDSQKDHGIYRDKKIIQYQKMDQNFDLIIISSFIYEQEMLRNVRKIRQNIPVYTFYEKLNGDIFTKYRYFLEYMR